MSPPRTPTLNQVIEHTVRAILRDSHTFMPGEVLSYDKGKQVVDVRPLLPMALELEDGSIEYREIAVLPNVRVAFPGGGGHRITFPLKKGDQVGVVFAEASIDRWQALGGFQEPNSLRRFHLADAVAYPGLRSDSWQGVSGDAATMGSDSGPQVVFRDTTIEFGARDDSPATEAMVLGTTYTGNEGSMLDQVSTALGKLAAELAVATSSLGIAGALNAVPMAGGAMAAPAFALVATQLGLIGGDVGTLLTAIATFRGQAATHTSTTLKVK